MRRKLSTRPACSSSVKPTCGVAGVASARTLSAVSRQAAGGGAVELLAPAPLRLAEPARRQRAGDQRRQRRHPAQRRQQRPGQRRAARRLLHALAPGKALAAAEPVAADRCLLAGRGVLAYLVHRLHDNRAERRPRVVVDALPVHRDTEEAGGAVGRDGRRHFLEVTARAFLAVVHAEDDLRAGRAGQRGGDCGWRPARRTVPRGSGARRQAARLVRARTGQGWRRMPAGRRPHRRSSRQGRRRPDRGGRRARTSARHGPRPGRRCPPSQAPWPALPSRHRCRKPAGGKDARPGPAVPRQARRCARHRARGTRPGGPHSARAVRPARAVRR